MELVEHAPSLEQMKRYFQRIGREMTPINLKQAMMPAGATVFPNDVGTAPGCAMEADGQCIILLPGPPREMKPMFENYVLGFLNRYLDGVIVTHTVHVFGMGESTIAERLSELLIAEQPVVATYASDGEVRIKITASGDKADACEAQCREAMKMICERLGDAVYGIDQPNLETVVVEALRRKKIKIAVAESCTAGLLSKRITDIPGASEVFECGVTTYSNQMKSELLGVSQKLLEENGAVSESVAKEMARGTLRTSRAGLALSITGIAGPGGGTAEKPVGLVYVAAKVGEAVAVRECRFRGGRRQIRNPRGIADARGRHDGAAALFRQTKNLPRIRIGARQRFVNEHRFSERRHFPELFQMLSAVTAGQQKRIHIRQFRDAPDDFRSAFPHCLREFFHPAPAFREEPAPARIRFPDSSRSGKVKRILFLLENLCKGRHMGGIQSDHSNVYRSH